MREAKKHLTKEQVLSIRNEYVPYKNGCIKLSKKYNVTRQNIFWIISRKSWTEI
jgi:hypothetical protein